MISGSIVPENIRNHSDIAKNIDKKTNKNIAKFFDKITEVFHCFIWTLPFQLASSLWS